MSPTDQNENELMPPNWHFESAAEFIDSLRRSNPFWMCPDTWKVDWVFRGQANASWGLCPTAWRPDVVSHPLYKLLEGSVDDEQIKEQLKENETSYGDLSNKECRAASLMKQKQFEFNVVLTFMDLVDELGFKIPGGRFSNHDRHLSRPFDDRVAFEDYHPAFGLAKHHNVPTRLLDWSFDPLVAAFFAADTDDESESVAVWALHPRGLQGTGYVQFKPERNQIGYLHAQHGLFTYHRHADFVYASTGKWPVMEDELKPTVLRKLTLCRSEVHQLRKLLWAERITRAHLMPTLDNISSCLNQTWERALQSQQTTLPDVSSN